MRLLVAVAILILPSLTATAAQEDFAMADGDHLFSVCSKFTAREKDANQSDEDFHRALLCAGYIRGFQEAHTLIAQSLAAQALGIKTVPTQWKSTSWYCLPATGSLPQMIKVVLRYLEQHPEELHRTSSYLIMAALQQAFPCK